VLAEQDPQSGPDNDRRDQESAPVIEEPFDPANQSLADALRASFRVLKLVMIVLVVLFLGSGLFIVDEQKEVVVLLRFGKVAGVYTSDLHLAWPYPIDEPIRVPTVLKTMMIDGFWLHIRDQDKGKDLSELSPRGKGLDPAVDGALLTGDRGIMHLLLQAQYRIAKADLFVRNVSDEARLLRSVLANAAVAEAARTTADRLWKEPGTVAQAIKRRAQRTLDAVQAGIRLEDITADESYFPLQVKDEVLAVSQAENRARELKQKARKERQEKLNSAAGAAWQVLAKKIEQLDQLPDGRQRDAVMKEIEDILVREAAGKAGERIKAAENQRARIVDDTLAQVRTFEELLQEYRLRPGLFRQRMRKNMLEELYAQSGVTKWILPSGVRQIVLWINKDPKETLDAERARAERKAKGGGE